MCPGTSPLHIKVGQSLGLSKNGSWVLVDARRVFFVAHELACPGRFKNLMKEKYESRSNLWFVKTWVVGCS